MKVNNEKYTHTQRRILNYFSSARNLFKKGNIRFKTGTKGIELSYHQSNFQWGVQAETIIPYKQADNEEKSETIWLVQDFIISCYYEFERDGRAMKLKDLACLVWTNSSTLNEKLGNIIKKVQHQFTPRY